jgi:hypothetical protein
MTVEEAYVRRADFGIELLDAVTLERVSQGVQVDAVGLQRKPIVNASGLFVWLRETGGPLQKVVIDPLLLPYERVELTPAQMTPPLTVVELPPRADYPFAAGITGMRGALIEERAVPPVPVRDAAVHLRWLDDNDAWRDAPAVSHTDQHGGFAAALRLAPGDVPKLDAKGALTVRLHARRGTEEKESKDRILPQGRVADPSTFPQGASALVFAWNEL